MSASTKKSFPTRINRVVAAAREGARLPFNERGVVESPRHTFTLGNPNKLGITIYAHPALGGWIADFELISQAHEVPARSCLPGAHSTVHTSLHKTVEAASAAAVKAAHELRIDRKPEAWAAKVEALESQRRGLLLDLLAQDTTLPLHGKTVIDMCSGAGGASLGFRLAGARVALAVEKDPQTRRMCQENVRPERMAADVCELNPAEVVCDILFVGMPCQAFSVAGQHAGLDDEKRGPVYRALMAMFRKADAKVIVIECARQFLTRNAGADAAVVRRELMKAGYLVQQRVLSAQCFGSPLARERAFMVATRIGVAADAILGFLFPREQAPRAVVADIMEPGLPATISENEIALHTAEPADRAGRRVEVGHIDNRNRQGYRVYSPRGVGATLTASGGGRARCSGAYKVPGGARGLTPREAHRGMGFPEWTAIHPVATHAYRHAGNAVSVPVAHALAVQLGALLGDPS